LENSGGKFNLNYLISSQLQGQHLVAFLNQKPSLSLSIHPVRRFVFSSLQRHLGIDPPVPQQPFTATPFGS
jgi:hypothetical protein